MSLEKIKSQMDFNGYSWFNLEEYEKKSNKPCFIPENAEDDWEVESYNSMFLEVLETIKTKDFLLAVCENYDKQSEIDRIENIDEKIEKIDYDVEFINITNETVEKFAENFMDSYFLSGDEVWCSISTKLQDYMM